MNQQSSGQPNWLPQAASGPGGPGPADPERDGPGPGGPGAGQPPYGSPPPGHPPQVPPPPVPPGGPGPTPPPTQPGAGPPPGGPPGGYPPAGGPVPPYGQQPPDPQQPAGGEIRTKRIRKLTSVPARYPLWVVALSVLIFAGPNLLVLVFDPGLEGTSEAALPDMGAAEMMFALIFTIILQIVVFAIAVLPLLFAGKPFSRLWGTSKATPLQWVFGIAAGVVALFLAYGVNIPLVLLFGDDADVEQDVMDMALSGGGVAVLAILVAVVLAPVTEEILFRGVLHRALADKIGVILGGIISAAIFAGIHIEVVFSQPYALAGLFVVGAVLAYAYHFTGSLIVPIVGHVVYNGISILLALVLQNFVPEVALLNPWLW